MQQEVCGETPSRFCSFLPHWPDLVFKLPQVTIKGDQQQLTQFGNQVLPWFQRSS